MSSPNIPHSDLLAEALAYASHHWAVFPLNGKMPAIPKRLGGRGVLDATSDLVTVTNWWSDRYAGCNIGGKVPENMLVLDVDPRHGGDESLAAHEKIHGKLPDTLTTVSGRGDGGMHLFFRRPVQPATRARARHQDVHWIRRVGTIDSSGEWKALHPYRSPGGRPAALAGRTAATRTGDGAEPKASIPKALRPVDRRQLQRLRKLVRNPRTARLALPGCRPRRRRRPLAAPDRHVSVLGNRQARVPVCIQPQHGVRHHRTVVSQGLHQVPRLRAAQPRRRHEGRCAPP